MYSYMKIVFSVADDDSRIIRITHISRNSEWLYLLYAYTYIIKLLCDPYTKLRHRHQSNEISYCYPYAHLFSQVESKIVASACNKSHTQAQQYYKHNHPQPNIHPTHPHSHIYKAHPAAGLHIICNLLSLPIIFILDHPFA